LTLRKTYYIDFLKEKKKLVDRENNEKVEVIMENDLKKFYDYKKLLESDIAKKSIENTKIIVDIKNKEISVSGVGNGIEDQSFEVIFGNIGEKKYYLEKRYHLASQK